MFREFIEDLRKSRRPVLLIGGGVRSAGAEDWARRLGARLKIPCIPTWNAVDIFTNDFEYYRGRIGTYGTRYGNFTIQNADLILAIGCRFSGRITGGDIKSFARGAKIYAVDIDKANLKYPTVKIDVPICMDAKYFIVDLMSVLLEQEESAWSWWLKQTKDWMDKYPVVLEEYYAEDKIVHPYVFVKVLSETLDDRDIVVADCGGNVVVVYQALETKFGQRVISSHGNSPMGFSFAGAIGAALAAPDRRVVCLIGDGGFNMNIQELQTIRNYNIENLKVFIMNNHIYGITRQFQDTHFESRYEASGPKGYNQPDFLPIADAYGIMGLDIRDHHMLRERIRDVIDYPRVIICDVNMNEYCKYEPRIAGFTPIEDMAPLLPRRELRQNMKYSMRPKGFDGEETAAWLEQDIIP